MKHLLLMVIGTFVVCACGQLTGANTGAHIQDDIENSDTQDKDSDTENIDSDTKAPIVGSLNASLISQNKYLLQGTAKNGGDCGHNFRLRFKLPDGERLTFLFYTDLQLESGTTYLFSRQGDSVFLEIRLNGKSHTRELQLFRAQEIIDLEIDLHNDHTDIHALIWQYGGPYEDYEDCSFDAGCIYNSEDFVLDHWLGVGKASGVYWGFEGDKNLILKLDGPLPAKSNA